VVLLAAATGLVAGAVPARRAARLDVLRAIAAD
jgi:ABC-type antimicrobial peptide transport system permease subunit